MGGKTSTTTASAKDAPKKAGRNTSITTTATSIDELSSLACAAKELEDVQRALTGSQNSFITLVKANSGVLDKNSPSFIKGVKALEYAVTSKKLRLGAKLDATIIGMFKLYAEVAKGDTDSEMPKTIGFWMPEDAAQFPITQGALFDRALPNGNVLQPVHWVFLYLHDYPDLVDGLISFRSKGNSIYTKLEKLVKAESSVVTELRFEISHQDMYNERYKKTDYYPKFEIVGRNYTLNEDGKVVRSKDSDLETEALKEILTRAKEAQEAYRQMKLVAKHDVTRLIGTGPARAALTAGNGGYYEDDEEDDSEADQHAKF